MRKMAALCSDLQKPPQEDFRGRPDAGPGAEIILVGARADANEAYGSELAPKARNELPDIFRELHLRKDRHPLKPLFEGKWE